MKIAFLSFYNGVVERGVETTVSELAKRLGKKHEVTVFQSGRGKGENYKVKQIQVERRNNTADFLGIRRRLFLDDNSLSILEFTRKILPELKKENFDVVIPWNNGWQSILCRFSNLRRVIISGQAGLGWEDRVNLYLFPDCFIGLTGAQVSWANKINPFVKKSIIPNGVDLARFRPQGAKAKIDLPKPIILSVAAFTSIKRLHLAIKAVSLMDKGSLVLVGKGQLREDLERLGRKLLPGRFKILEAKYSEIDEYYRAADVFTFPTSAWEGFGIVMVEALATNLPVVAANDPIRKEVVGKAGCVVNVNDAPAYSLALEKALETSWGNLPRKQSERYSWDDIAESYERLFESLI